MFPSFQFFSFPLDDFIQNSPRNVTHLEHGIIEETNAAAGHRPQGQFLMAGHAQFSDEENIQRRPQPRGHLVGNRHAPARQPQDNQPAPPRVTLQLRGQAAPGFPAVLELKAQTVSPTPALFYSPGEKIATVPPEGANLSCSVSDERTVFSFLQVAPRSGRRQARLPTGWLSKCPRPGT